MNNLKSDLQKTDALAADMLLFEQARRHYLEKEFEQARELILKYRQSVRYQLVKMQDRRSRRLPGVSVIVVSYGAGPGLLECLDTLGRQSDPDFEIIIVDNGGNQEIFEQLAEHPVLHLQPPINLLPSEGRNLGAHFARGDLLAFVDDDALVHFDYVEKVKTAWRIFDFSALRGRILPRSASANETVSGHYDLGRYPVPAVLMTEGNMAIKKEVFSAVGGFDPLVFGGEGTELTHRCLKRFPGRDIYYWPHMLVFHDFVRGKDFAAKKQRHAIASAYFQYLAPEINRLQGKYGRWYQARPGNDLVYDQRSFATKVRAWIVEKWIVLVNWIDRRDGKPMPDSTIPEVVPQGSGKLSQNTQYKELVEKLQVQLEETRSSIAFRLGSAIAEASVSPLKKGLWLPFKLAGLAKDHIKKQKTARGYSGNNSYTQPGANLRNRKKYLQPGIEEHIFDYFTEFMPFKTTCNSDLRIACVIGRQLHACLDFEAKLTALTFENWQNQLVTCRPDLLLVQSAWDFCEPGWKEELLKDHGSGQAIQAIQEVLDVCRTTGIPTVFWDTECRTHFSFFSRVALLFDHVFAADPVSVERYKAILGVSRVSHLPIAIQPALHNPVRHEDFVKKSLGFTILFDGWADVLEQPEQYEFLKDLLGNGLHIVESRCRFVANKLKDLPELQAHIMGYLAYSRLISALRVYPVFLISADSLSSPLSLAQKAMEAAACGAAVVYKGSCNELIPAGVAIFAESGQQAVDQCRKFLQVKHERAVHSLQSMRQLFSAHTYAHRIQAICRTMGIKHGWEEYPRITVITPTKRPEYLSEAIKNYQRQTYPNKQWTIIVNTSGKSVAEIENRCKGIDGVRIIQLHEEKNIGACLNLGIEWAEGEYWFKMDDDDYYGPDYVLDMMLEMRAVDADIFGKPTGFIYFEDDDVLMHRNMAWESQHLYGCNRVPHMCGATISGKTSAFDRVYFAEDMRACVDTDFIRRCAAAGHKIYLSHFYGFTAMRRKDKSLHTWRADDDMVKRNATPWVSNRYTDY